MHKDLKARIFKLPSNRVWRSYLGGRELDRIEGRQVVSDRHYPEDWIASTTLAKNGDGHPLDEGISSVCINDREIPLQSLFGEAPDFFLGAEHFGRFGSNTGFLLKFLDSAVRLQLQCHPTKDFSRRFLGSEFGKTEGYYILDVRPEVKEPFIYAGFQHLPDKEEFKSAVERQDSEFILSCFERIPVRRGDAFIIPGGLPHSIGEGIMMMELMEPSDFAVRIEFRCGDRELPHHLRYMGKDIDFGMSVFDFKRTAVDDFMSRHFVKQEETSGAGVYTVFDSRCTDCFRMKRVVVDKSAVEMSEDSFFVAVIIGGDGVISSGATRLKAGRFDKFFVPYAGRTITAESGDRMELLIVQPPA